MTIGNIKSATRNSPFMHANVLIALLPVPPKFSGSKQKDDILRERSHDIFKEIIELILQPLAEAGEGLPIDCGDGK